MFDFDKSRDSIAIFKVSFSLARVGLSHAAYLYRYGIVVVAELHPTSFYSCTSRGHSLRISNAADYFK